MLFKCPRSNLRPIILPIVVCIYCINLITSANGLLVLLLVEGGALIILVLLLFIIYTDFLLTVVLVQSNLLTGEPLVTKLLIQTSELRRSVGVLLVTLCVVEDTVILTASAERLTRT